MAQIFTADMAERRAQTLEAMGFTVMRDTTGKDAQRIVAGLVVHSSPYATVWKKNSLRMIIRHEWIAEGSELL